MINRLFAGPLMEGEPSGGGGGLKKGEPLTLEQVNQAASAAVAKWAKDNLPGAIKDATKDLGTSLTSITETLTTLQTALTSGGGDGKGKGKDDKGDDGLTPELRVRLAKYEKDAKDTATALAQEKEKREAAEKAQKETAKQSAIRRALGQHTFASDEAAEDAFVLINGKVDYDPDDPTRLLAEGLPLDDFVANYIPEKKPHLLAAQGKGGAGANGGSPKGGPSSKVNVEDITAANLYKADGTVDTAKLSAFAGAIANAMPKNGPTR